MFRQTQVLSLLLGYHIPVEGAEHRGSYGRFCVLLFAEYAKKSFAFRFLGLFLHTSPYNYWHLIGYLIVNYLLLFEYLYNLAHLSFLIFEKMTHTVNALCRIGNFETA